MFRGRQVDLKRKWCALMKRYRICFLSSMHRRDDKRVHYKEARSLASAGFDVLHICPGPESGLDEEDGVQVRSYVPQEGLIGRVLQLRYLYRLAVEIDADAYHCNEVDSWIVGVALKIIRNKRCVFDVHEHYPSTLAQSRFPRILQPIVVSLVRFVYRILTPFTDRLVFAKRTVEQDFKSPPEKVALVRNFAPYEAADREFVRRTRRNGDPMTVVHLGLFNKVRGWPQVLAAVSRSDNNVGLLVIGSINDGSEKEFRSRVRDLGLEGRVSLIEWLPFDQAFEHLLNSDVGLVAFQPHIQNNAFAMPHKLFDYMAAGLSVILPRQAVEVAPIVEDVGCGLLVDTSDPDDLARAIAHLNRFPEEARRMGERGREAVRQTYNWEAEAKRLISMYEHLCMEDGLERQ